MEKIYNQAKTMPRPSLAGISDEATIPIEVGMLGYSLEPIIAKEKGYVLLPLGVLDPAKVSGRKWVKVKVTALEDIDANIDIVVANELGQIKPYTIRVSIPQLPGELSDSGALMVDVPMLSMMSAAFLMASIGAPPLGTIILNTQINYNPDGTALNMVFTTNAPGQYTLTFTWATVAGSTFLVNVTRT